MLLKNNEEMGEAGLAVSQAICKLTANTSEFNALMFLIKH